MQIETRACRAEEMETLMALVNRVFRSGREGDMRSEYPLVFATDNLDNLRVVPGETGPVAHVGVCLRDASILGARVTVASIGAVGTDPERRGGGLASALMADARRHARERGAALMLISGGRGLYHRMGYVTVGQFHRYHWSADELSPIDARQIEVTRYREGELDEVAALHQTEPVRFIRSRSDWQQLLAAGMLMNAKSDLLTVRQEGHPIAYVGIQQPGHAAARVARIQEFAGSRQAVIAALPALLAQFDAEGVSLTTRRDDFEMAVLGRQYGWSPALQAFPGTLGVIDPASLIDALRPLLAERAPADLQITATQDGATFELGSQTYSVGAPGPLAALLFGGETEEARAIPPRDGPLGTLLDRVFPLPLLWPGYNYV